MIISVKFIFFFVGYPILIYHTTTVITFFVFVYFIFILCNSETNYTHLFNVLSIV